MKTPARTASFVVVLVVIFGVGFGTGGQVDPYDDASSAGGPSNQKDHAGAGRLPGGLMVSESGYTLRPTQAPTRAGTESELRFSIAGPDGDTVTKFTPTHDKELHLIVVRRDLAHYQHVHPAMDNDGTWRLPVTVPEAGQYRMFTDFQPKGRDSALTLGADFAVSGDYSQVPLPEPVPRSSVDGYEVSISGELVAGKTSKVTLTVSKDGQPITDLQPYLDAYGHLVALRDGDLAYLHVHPDGEPGDGKTKAGPQVVFYAEVPSAGSYRLYLDFRHGDVVRTAEFTAVAVAPDTSAESADKSPSDDGGMDHGGMPMG